MAKEDSNGLSSLLLATLNRSLQFNSSIREFSSESDPSGSSWGSTSVDLPGAARGPRAERAPVGRRAGKNSHSLNWCPEAPQRKQRPSWRRLSISSWLTHLARLFFWSPWGVAAAARVGSQSIDSLASWRAIGCSLGACLMAER